MLDLSIGNLTEIKVNVYEAGISDHNLLHLQIYPEDPALQYQKQIQMGPQQWKHYSNLLEDLVGKNWNALTDQDVNKSASLFQALILKALIGQSPPSKEKEKTQSLYNTTHPQSNQEQR